MYTNYHYNKQLKNFSVEKRNEMTKAESCLWKYALRAKQMRGKTFNRQRPVLWYIADFMCKDLNLIIEVDSYSHQLEENYEKDLIRQTNLEKAGYRVIRFKDSDVLRDIKNVRTVISNAMEELEEMKNKSSPCPLQRGTS